MRIDAYTIFLPEEFFDRTPDKAGDRKDMGNGCGRCRRADDPIIA